MPQISSLRADTGLPEILHGATFLNADGSSSYWADGTTWLENRGSVLAGKAAMEPQKMFREGQPSRIVRTTTLMGRR